MEVRRPDRLKGYGTTLRVGLLLSLSYSFSKLAWNFVDELYYGPKRSRAFYIFFTLACVALKMVGEKARQALKVKDAPKTPQSQKILPRCGVIDW